MKDFQTGIIIRIFDSGANDKIIHFINTDGEKVSALAKSVRKSTSSKQSAIEIGNKIKVKLILGYNLPILSSVKIISENLAWKSDYEKTIILQMICEVMEIFSHEAIIEKDFFQVLDHTLGIKKLTKPKLLLAIFLLKILKISGHISELRTDVVSGDALSADNSYESLDHIGYISGKTESHYKSKANVRIQKSQSFILNNSVFASSKLALEDAEINQMLKLHIHWIELLAEKELKSKKVVLRGLG
ncbi:MAG: hypothetical protein Kow0081_1810 [Candidatus Dojkabacteria bacterium]